VSKSSPLACALLLGVVTQPRAASADTGPNSSPYEVRWALDLPLAAGAAAVWLLPASFLDEIVKPSCPCARDAVSSFDTFSLGRHSSAANTASDVIVATLTAAPFIVDAIDVGVSGSGWSGYAADVMVMAEVLAINGAVTETFKLAARRPRPLLYDAAPGEAALTTPDNYLSFFSGHTSTTMAATLAYASTFAFRHPDSPARYALYGGAVVVGGGMAFLRMLSGKHFPTDVLAGAAAGAAVGLAVPRLHLRHREATAVPVAGGALILFGGRM
jgi:membrane-associated phospholipid phosphatase